MKRKRKLFGRHGKAKESGEIALQITSMADIFTILLVFLLKGLASDALQITPSNAKIPSGIHTTTLSDQALQVEISKDGILIERDFVSKLEDFHLSSQSVGADGSITALSERLSKERERQKLIAQANDTVKIDGRAIILSDEKVPFSTMKTVLKTLAAQGYSEIKFAVIKE